MCRAMPMNTRNKTSRHCGGAALATLATACLCLTGCPPPPRLSPPPKLTLQQAIQRLNANNAKIDHLLYKRVRFLIKFRDDKGVKRRFDMSGAIRYEKPRNLYLTATYAGSVALRAGSNGRRYWLGVKPQVNTLSWGYWANLGRPCTEQTILQPDKLIEALGVNTIDLSNENYIGPVLLPRQDANVLLFRPSDAPLGSGAFFTREIHLLRREPFLIKQIRYLDAEGRDQLIIKLDRYAPAREGGPYLAHRIEMHWPEQEGYFRADVRSVTVGKPAPSAAFAFPDATPYDRVYQLDEACP